ncbi:uncharacterized protein LOC132792388 [Drosophila nasuta]|uniref:uncharacterized protein LOC132792388 n=1 Tax=Drosophila nasuta TaxID=42062 RepID=UPI00295F415A|nr:uncharacterized protein LOC132792388 [Drosophila nasuta]
MEEPIRSPFSTDIPHAFIYNDSRKAKSYYRGPYAESIQSFAQVFHYALQMDHIDSLPNKRDLQELIAEGVYNMSVHGVLIRTLLDDPRNITQYSYPLEVMRNCVMVPLAPELPKWMYMVWPLGRYVWTSLFLSIFYVAFLLRYVHWEETIARSYTRNLLHAMALLMYSPNMNMQLRMIHVPLRTLVFYTLLYIQGFILSNYHISHMTSFDMKPVFVKPINTWADLIESRVRIIIPDTLLEEIRSLPGLDVSSLNPQFKPLIWQDYQNLLTAPPRQFAYVVTQDAWDFFNRQQAVLIQPYFHMSQVCFNGLFNAYPLQKDAPFADALDRFMLYVRQAGLWGYWEDMAFIYAVRANYAKVFLDTYPVEPLNLEFFSTAWIVIVVGLPISLVVYLLEYLWWRCSSTKLRYNQ